MHKDASTGNCPPATVHQLIRAVLLEVPTAWCSAHLVVGERARDALQEGREDDVDQEEAVTQEEGASCGCHLRVHHVHRRLEAPPRLGRVPGEARRRFWRPTLKFLYFNERTVDISVNYKFSYKEPDSCENFFPKITSGSTTEAPKQVMLRACRQQDSYKKETEMQ